MSGYIGSRASVVSSGAERKKTFDITGTTTSLTGLSYTVNQVHVFHNGVRLVDGTDFTATNGSSITLTNAAESGDEVVVLSYAGYQVSDTVSASQGGTFSGAVTIDADLSVDGGTIKLDGNYPVGTDNVALGNAALDSLTSGTGNIAVGDSTLTSVSSGINNVGVGTDALKTVSTGSNNVAMGFASLEANTGSNNTAVGFLSLLSNTTADNNTAVGYQAGYSNTTATHNTFIGRGSGYSTTTGGDNVALGSSALYTNAEGTSNISIGYSSMYYNTSGTNNVALGKDALQNNTTASYNTAVGYRAGYNNTTGLYNTFVGTDSGYAVTTGSKNTILGVYNGNQFGLDIRTSSNNIVLSDGDGNPRVYVDSTGACMVGATVREGNGVTLYGNGANGMYVATTSTTNYWVTNLGLGAGAGNIATIYSDTAAVGTISVTATSTAYNTSSDYRLKENVVELTGATDRLKQLNPSRFNFIADADTTVDGFLAHEVQAIVPEAVTGTKDEVDADGNPVYQGIDQSKLVPLLTAALQEALTEIQDLKARVATLEGGAA